MLGFLVRMHDDPEEEDNVPLKRKKTASVDKGKQVQTQVLALPRAPLLLVMACSTFTKCDLNLAALVLRLLCT